jgi:hypothetical protein
MAFTLEVRNAWMRNVALDSGLCLGRLGPGLEARGPHNCQETDVLPLLVVFIGIALVERHFENFLVDYKGVRMN